MSGTTLPTAAVAAGFNTETFGSSVTLGSNWYPFNFYSVNPSQVNATQNSDGSVTIDGGGDTYQAQLCTAELGSQGQIEGDAFGGGLYTQATIAFTGPTYGLYGSASNQWPAFWANTVEGMATGQSRVETDFMEMDGDAPYQYGTAMHWWPASGSEQSTQSVINVASGTNLNQPNTYGFLWIPATPTTQGSAEWFFDGEQVGQTVTWAYGSSSPWANLDGGQLALILGTGPNSPMTVSDVEVWQASASNDIINGVAGPGGGAGVAPTITPVTPQAVGPGQTTEVATTTPGTSGDTLTVTETSATFGGTLSLQSVNGVEEVIFTAPATIAANETDTVAYTVNDSTNGTSTTGSTSVSLTVPTVTPEELSVVLSAQYASSRPEFMILLDGKSIDTGTITRNGNQTYSFEESLTPGSTHTVAIEYISAQNQFFFPSRGTLTVNQLSLGSQSYLASPDTLTLGKTLMLNVTA